MNQPAIRVLCVDDEPLNLSLLEAMLSPRGYEVLKAQNGVEALEKIRTESIDICLLDVMLPEMDGFEVCRCIKADTTQDTVPVIMITALADIAHRIKGIEAGADDFITKPFNASEVLARIKMLVHVNILNNRLHAAYDNIVGLSMFAEQIICSFDPFNFVLLQKIDSIVQHLIGKGAGFTNGPQIVVIGMVDQAEYQWVRYDAFALDSRRSSMTMNIDDTFVFAPVKSPLMTFHNEAEVKMAAPELVAELTTHGITVTNMARYATESFCLTALNYGREVTSYDASVLRSVVIQSLFLRSLAAQIKDTASAFEYTVFALARASEANDEDTGDHILRVGNYCGLLAQQLNMPDTFTQDIRIQAALHDVGKIHIAAAILKKTGKLTDSEWVEMKRHTLHGSTIIGGHQRMSMADRIALSHHERYDGSGYPFGLTGHQIPIEGRIMNLADQYDALRNARCYKPAFDHDTTCRIIIEGDGRTLPEHFDPKVLAAFKNIHEKFAAVFEASNQTEKVKTTVNGG